MPKVRTMDDEIKSMLTKKKKANPFQKIKGMPNENAPKSILERHNSMMRFIEEDLNEKKLPTGFITQPPFPVPSEKKTCMGLEVGSAEYERMIDFMRADLESGMRLSQMIEIVKGRMKEDGLDFNEEFEKWKAERKRWGS